jgi:PAS domain S-box-containing protein
MKRFIRDAPIKQKLTIIMMLTAGLSLSLAGIAFFTYENIYYRRELVSNNNSLAQIIASNSSAALAFNDPKDATATLASLSTNAEIERAALYDAKGNLFATYIHSAADITIPPRPGSDGAVFDGAMLHTYFPVILQQDRVGTVFLAASLEPLYARRKLYALIIFAIMLVSAVGAYALSTGLQRLISHPILSLSRLAKEVSERQDYSVRARKSAPDELGELVDSFNHMLAQIEARDRALNESQQRLKLLVQNTPLGVVVWNRELKILEWNKAAEHIFGFAEAEAVGQSVHLFIPDDEWTTVSALIDNLLNKRGGERNQNQNITKNGRRLICEWYNAPLLDAQGNVFAVASLVEDVTQRVEAEEAFRKLSERFSRIYESSKDAIGYMSLDCNFLDVNAAFTQMTGYSKAELLQRTCESITPPEFGEIEAKIVEKVFTSGNPVEYEKECVRKNGSRFPVLVTKFIVRGDNGQPAGLAEIVKDITERKQSEAEIRRLNAELEERVVERTAQLRAANDELHKAVDEIRDLYNRAPCGYHSLNPNGIFVLVNDTELDWLGYSRDELVGKKRLGDLMTPESAAEFAVSFPIFLSRGYANDLEYEMIKKDGTRFWVIINATAVRDAKGNILRTRSTLFDITERKHIEQALRASEQRFNVFFESSASGMAIIDGSGRYTRVNPAYCRIQKRSEKDLLGMHFNVTSDPAETEENVQLFQKFVRGELKTLEIERRISRPDGSSVWAYVSVTSVAENASTNALFVQIIDITERKLADAALRESENRFSVFFDSSPSGMAILNHEGKYIRLNRAFCEMHQCPMELLLNAHFMTIVMPEFVDVDRELFQKLQSGEIQTRQMEQSFKCPTGDPVWTLCTITAVGDKPNFRMIFIQSLDITERRRIEEELAHRIEELGRSNRDLEAFAYVASHDLQEPLRAVSGCTQILAENYKGKLDKDADTLISYTIGGVLRMQSLIQDLLAYSRVGRKSEPHALVDTEEALNEAIENLRTAISESQVTITHESLPTVFGDRVQLVQLLQNLISNAIKYRSNVPPKIHISAREQTGEWLFSINDNGIGIDPQYHDRIFVIFQRLHGRDRAGTGIGLAICKRIVEQHDGRIWVRSETGKGATFYFTLAMKESGHERKTTLRLRGNPPG